jgi:transcriptional regulator with XRE-family HTH domain
MAAKAAESAEIQNLGQNLGVARRARGLSQVELAERSGLSQAQISYFEVAQRRPTLDQLLRISRALECPIQRLFTGADRPGKQLRDIAIELRSLGLVDLWVEGPFVPGAFRAPEEVIALAVSGIEPDPRVVEAIPAILAWNPISPVLLKAYSVQSGLATVRRLAWLGDIALVIDRRGEFPGGCKRDQLARFLRIVRAPDPKRVAWDGLGHPMAELPTSPVWKRWRMNYDSDLNVFHERARVLRELSSRSIAAAAGSSEPPSHAHTGRLTRTRRARHV